MVKKNLGIILVILLTGIIATGCPKKVAVKEDPSAKEAQEMAADRARAERMAAERTEQEAKDREAARLQEEARKAEQARKDVEARRAEEARKTQAQKEAEKSLVQKKYPGIEGEVYESKSLKDIRFDFDKYDVRSEDVAILKENAAFLAKNPQMKIQIEGHCDERGTNEYNLALGERRANSAKKYLVSLGIATGRISTISYGEERPVDTGHNEEAWTKNRRAHFIVLSK